MEASVHLHMVRKFCSSQKSGNRRVGMPWISLAFKANMLNSNYWKTAVIMYRICYTALWATWLTLHCIQNKMAARKCVNCSRSGRAINNSNKVILLKWYYKSLQNEEVSSTKAFFSWALSYVWSLLFQWLYFTADFISKCYQM